MTKHSILIIYLLTMVAVIVIMDILFFRHKFWERLLANIGTVLIFIALYLAFFKNR